MKPGARIWGKRIPRALRRVVLVAESNDLAEKWVSFGKKSRPGARGGQKP